MTEFQNTQRTTLKINDLEFTEESSFIIMGKKYETLALYSSILAVVIMCLIWYYSGLFKKCKKHKGLIVIFILGILSFVMLIYKSSVLKGSILYERDRLVEVRQNITTLLGSIVVVVFVINYYKRMNTKIMKVFYTCIISLIALNFMISEKNTGYAVASSRKPKQYIFNVIVITLVAAVYMELLYLDKPPASHPTNKIH